MTEEPSEVAEQLNEMLESNGEEIDDQNVEHSAELAVELWEQLDEDVVDVEPLELANNFYRYLDHNVEPESARSTILRNQASAEGLEIGDILEEGSSSEVPDLKVEEIDEPDQFINVEVEVTDLWDNDTESISQIGLVHDDTGRIKFKTWEKSEAPILTEGQTYRLERVATDEYNGNMEISINSNTEVEMIDKEFDEPSTTETFTGSLVDVQAGSGLIQRCSKDECNRVLNDGTCQEHGDVEGDFDLRVKAVLDNGIETQDVILDKELTEQITGIRIDEAEQMAKDALDTDVVGDEMADRILLKYYTVEGWISDYGMIVEDIEEYAGDDNNVSELVERLSALNTSDSGQSDLTEVN